MTNTPQAAPTPKPTPKPTPNSGKLSTPEFAKHFLVKPETVRRAFCINGHYLGHRPEKLGNRRLAWPDPSLEG